MNNGIFNSPVGGLDRTELNHSLDDTISLWGPSFQVAGDNEPDLGSTLTNSNGCLVISTPTGNIEGPWTEAGIIPFDSKALSFQVMENTLSTTIIPCNIQIGVGAAGKEESVLSIPVLGRTNTYSPVDVWGPFPLAMKTANRRVAIRRIDLNGAIQSVLTTRVTLQFHRTWPRSCNKVEILPTENLSSLYYEASSIADPGVANTKGAWSSIGLLPFDTKWVVPFPSVIQGASWTATRAIFDYGYLEQDGITVTTFLGTIMSNTDTTERYILNPRAYPVKLSAGTEIMWRVATSTYPSSYFGSGNLCVGAIQVFGD